VELDLTNMCHCAEDNTGFCNLMRSLKTGLRRLILPKRHLFTHRELQSIVQFHSPSLNHLGISDLSYETCLYSATDLADLIRGIPHLHTLLVPITRLHALQAHNIAITSTSITHLLIDFDSTTATKLPDLTEQFPAITKLSLRWTSVLSTLADLFTFLALRPLTTTVCVDDKKVREQLRAAVPHIKVLEYGYLDIYSYAY